jgi:hypothetical protein
MVLVQNFDVYFPVQRWVSSAHGVRFQPPLLGYKQEYRFNEVFWPSHEHERMKTVWALETVFWAINPKYYLYANRGMMTVRVRQDTAFPFASIEADVFTDPLSVYKTLDIFENSFSFCAYSYPVRGTHLLYMHTRSSDDALLYTEYCSEKEGCPPVASGYHFLPNKANKDVSCYDLRVSNINLFLYVFPERPRGEYFRLTTEGLCVPSSAEGDFPSFFDCMTRGVQSRMLPSNLFTGSTNPALQTVMNTFPRNDHARLGFGPALWLLLIVSVLLLLVQLQRWRPTPGR